MTASQQSYEEWAMRPVMVFLYLCPMQISDLILRWQALWHPERYHGWGRRRGYFEGWYVKLVSADGALALAIIPGIARKPDGQSEAFIQVLDGVAATATYHSFPVDQFLPRTDRFAVDIAGNRFSDQGIRLDLPDLVGEVRFLDGYPWPTTLGAPGIMGWYAFMPFMECYHGVWSMHHRLEGQLTWKGRTVSLQGGIGYGEKDWGTSFPRGWIWMQSSHFETDRRISVMASVAHIPWLGNSFVGFIGGILLDDRLIRFASYTGARRKATIAGEELAIGFRDQRHELTIRATPGPGAHLQSPIRGEMAGKVNESLQATLDVTLRENGQVIFQGTGRWAGLEASGEVDSLQSTEWVS